MSIVTTVILNAYLDRSLYVFVNYHFATNGRDVGASLQHANCLRPFPTSPSTLTVQPCNLIVLTPKHISIIFVPRPLQRPTGNADCGCEIVNGGRRFFLDCRGR
jgi:hypothetical protein